MDDMTADPTPLLLSIKEQQAKQREEQALVSFMGHHFFSSIIKVRVGQNHIYRPFTITS
jgi:hypothetical protein